VSRRKLLDSFALLSYLNKERGFEKVREALAEAQVSDGSVLMNEVNVGETYYILHRQRGVQEAEYFLDTVLVGLPILLVQNDFQNVIDAARIKAEYPLSSCHSPIVSQWQLPDEKVRLFSQVIPNSKKLNILPR
jgi:PIN domain nuclease of toxin-antitoxin system